MTNTNAKAVASFLKIASFVSLFLLAVFPHPVLSTESVQAFDFLQQLHERHKGETFKSIRELKQYLRKFGYLDVYNNHTGEHEDNDDFDGILESGIKTYQLNYNLKATGRLDAQTVKQMKLPRCGVPDIVNGKTSMRSGKKKHISGGKSRSPQSVSLYSFFQGSPRWPASKTHLTYQFSSTIPVNDLKTMKTVISRAFARWAEVSHFKFSEAFDEADIVIGFYSGDHGDGASFDGPGGMLAHSFSPTDGRLHFDAEENWSTDPGQDMMDIETVAVHEIGHLLGLEHTSEPKAIMYPIILFGSLKRQLHGDDVRGIRALYSHSA